MNKLEIINVKKYFKNFQLNVSFTVKDNEFVSILGPSGSGKSTTLHIVAGFIEMDSGRVIKNGKDISKLPPSKRNMGIVFQDYALFPYLNVFNNIAFGLKIRKERPDIVRQKVYEIAEKMNISGILYKYPHNISGGEKQRVALARAMIVKPDILLMDEPFSSLDAKIKAELMEELRHFHKQTSATVLYVTHDQSEAMYLSDRIILMNEGKIDQIASPLKLYEHPKTKFAREFIGKMNKIILNGKEFYVRPEDIEIKRDGKMSGIITELVFLGGVAEIKIKTKNNQVLAREIFRRAKHLKVGEIIHFNINGGD